MAIKYHQALKITRENQCYKSDIIKDRDKENPSSLNNDESEDLIKKSNTFAWSNSFVGGED